MRLLGLLIVLLLAVHGRAAERPNVLFIAVDDLRPELRCYGREHMVTPNMDRLAATGRLFERHYVAVPTCGASRYAMLTGKRPNPTTESVQNSAFNLLNGDPETWVHLLRKNGWHTACLGKITHEPDGLRWTNDPKAGGDDRGRLRVRGPETPHSWTEILFDHGRWGPQTCPLFAYANGSGRAKGVSPAFEIGVDARGNSLPDNAYPDGRIAEVAIEKLREFKDDRTTFCFAVGFYRPHLPFAAPKKYYDLYDPAKLPGPFPESKPTGAEPATVSQPGEINNYRHPVGHRDSEYRRKLRHGYFASVSYVDAQIGKVLDALDELGLADHTIVVLWGDHGWQLDDYGLLGKHTLFERSLHSPLIIRAPDMPSRGVPAPGLVESIDIYSTIAELCGLTAPAELPGSSLVPLLRDPAAPGKAWVYSAFGGRKESIRTDRWRLISSGREPVYDLYDLQPNPFELKDVSAKEPAVLEDLIQNKLRVQSKLPSALAKP